MLETAASIIGFTGSQKGLTSKQSANLKRILYRFQEDGSFEFHHGDCVGADAAAHAISKELGYIVILHPPTSTNKRAFCEPDEIREPLGYLERNEEIVKSSDVLIACPKEIKEQRRSGTWSTVRRAKKYNKKILFLFPDGDIKIFKPKEDR